MRENFKANEEKTSIVPTAAPFLKTPSLHRSLALPFTPPAPLLCPLSFTYPPELHLGLEYTVTIKDNVDMKLREKNDRGSNNARRSKQVMTTNQATGVIHTSTRQSESHGLTALPSRQGTMEPTWKPHTATLPVRLLYHPIH